MTPNMNLKAKQKLCYSFLIYIFLFVFSATLKAVSLTSSTEIYENVSSIYIVIYLCHEFTGFRMSDLTYMDLAYM
jgi:hypothetical protein